MKLIFDQNLSPKLVNLLVDIFQDSAHVTTIGLATATDRTVWDYALKNDFIIVTKDSDFNDLSSLLGFPPKIIWIKRGNCSTKTVETVFRNNYADIVAFSSDINLGLLVLL